MRSATSNDNSDKDAEKQSDRAEDSAKKTTSGRSNMSGFISFLFSAIVFVITFGFVLGYMFKGTYQGYVASMYWGFAAYVAAGVAIFSGFHYFVLAPSKANTPRLSFSVAQELAITSQKYDSPSFWFGFENGTQMYLSPVSDVMYVRLTNGLESKPLLIDSYFLEVRVSGKPWKYATRFRQRDIERGKIFSTFLQNGPANSVEVTETVPQFEQVIREKNIGAGETVRGLIFVERPAGYDAHPDARQWRLTIRDVNGAEGNAVITRSTMPRGDDSITELYFKPGKRTDITGMTFILYSKTGRYR